jgi:hypothetical protein
MGWASGSYLAENIWNQINQFIPIEHIPVVAHIIYTEFSNYDADDWSDTLENIALSYQPPTPPIPC